MEIYSPVFLFLFFPVVVSIYLLAGKKLRTVSLLISSLIFCGWGRKYVFVLCISIIVNYSFALLIERMQKNSLSESRTKLVLAISLVSNLGCIIFYKYINFIIDNLNKILITLKMASISNLHIYLPLGLSFYTFQAISYVIDVYRRDIPAQKNPINIALYLSLFPKIGSGPIARYHTIAPQIRKNILDLNRISTGTRRFIMGLAKKTLIADTLARPVDLIFLLPKENLTLEVSWVGILCYTLQIYFDLSGYTDMAIGIGKIFGFEFPENFNYPYISKSIREFWRRWHISLSTWFRDYLYIPLGGNRCSPIRNYMNLITVFLLCGLWHGASWTFVLWGLWHGIFLVIERTRTGRIIEKAWYPLRYCYALLVIIIGWVFFRSDSFSYSIVYLKTMFGISGTEYVHSPYIIDLNREVYFTVIIGTIACFPSIPLCKTSIETLLKRTQRAVCQRTISTFVSITYLIFYLLIGIASVMQVASVTYRPFIYAGF